MSLDIIAGDPNADSYADTTFATAYFTPFGQTAWPGGDTPQLELALRMGTQYLENQYRGRWIGIRTNQTQSLSWPRGDGARELWRTTILYPLLDLDGFAMDTQIVPLQVQQATCEAALLVLTGTNLQPVLTRDANYVKSVSTNVAGAISKATVYIDGTPVIDQYLAIEGLLRGLVTSTPGATSGVVRLARG